MSLNHLFEISRRSFTSLQGAMNTVGQNVANANTEGYARRRLTLQSESTAVPGLHARAQGGVLGAGVSIQAYERVRDGLAEAAAWKAQGDLGGADESYRILSALEGLFPSGDTSLSAQIGRFWDSWADLSDNPTEPSARQMVRSQGQSLAALLNRLDGDVQTLAEETKAAFTSGVDEMNGKLRRLAALNDAITNARHGGTPDLAAEDERDVLVKELAAFAPLRVQQDAPGGYRIAIGGMVIVDGAHATEMQLDLSGATPEVSFGDTGVAFQAPTEGGGKLGAWLRALGVTVPQARQGLDALARALVTNVNSLHTNVTDGGGIPLAAPNFFHYAAGPPETGLTAASIRLSDDVLADAGVIAPQGHYFTDASGREQEVALALAGLRDAPLLNGQPLHGAAVDFVSALGSQAQRAATQATGSATAVQHLSALAAGVSGVSLEEEMTNMIQFQQAFGASARVLSTAQSMMDTLLQM